MNYRTLLLSFVASLVIIGCTPGNPGQQGSSQTSVSPSTPVSVMEARKIDVTAESFAFAPNVIKAKKGEKVVVHLTGKTGLHGFAIPDLGVNVPIAAGQVVDVALPTDKVGTFTLLCSIPCGSGHREMKGTVTIEE